MPIGEQGDGQPLSASSLQRDNRDNTGATDSYPVFPRELTGTSSGLPNYAGVSSTPKTVPARAAVCTEPSVLWHFGEVAMNSVIEAVPTRSTVSRETISTRFFRISYLTAIVFWTIGWISALSWITVRLARWLLT